MLQGAFSVEADSARDGYEANLALADSGTEYQAVDDDFEFTVNVDSNVQVDGVSMMVLRAGSVTVDVYGANGSDTTVSWEFIIK